MYIEYLEVSRVNTLGKKMQDDEKYMKRCLELAEMAKGLTSPNPMVGAVVVCRGEVIGEGFHQRCGEPHAEVNAIASVETLELLRQSTLYVNLEPCSHYGKTPPCAKLIIETGIPRVVVGGLDPFHEVAGRGVRMLRDAGVDVKVGVCEADCEALNRRFLTFHRQHRPYLILKWAQSTDGFIGRADKRILFSTPGTLRLVYQMRSEEDAVLVGTNTAVADNPVLGSHGEGIKNPIRIAIDRTLRIPRTHHLFDGRQRTLIFTESAPKGIPQVEFIPIRFNSSESVLPQMMSALYERNVQSVIVEGGRHLLQSCIDRGLCDEVRIEKSPIRLGSGIKAPQADLTVRNIEMVDGNELIFGNLK